LAQLINEHNVNQKIQFKTRDLGHFTWFSTHWISSVFSYFSQFNC